MHKTLIGSQLRQLRREHGHTQAEMARRLNVSPAYVNLLENNQRALSVKMLMALTEAYGLDLREVVNDRDLSTLADLRAAVADPAFARHKPDLQELRAVVDHAPRFAELFLSLYRSHHGAVAQLARLGSDLTEDGLLDTAAETAIHDFFRDNRNYFHPLEEAAGTLRAQIGGASDDMYALLKRHLRMQFQIGVVLKSTEDMPDTLRFFDRAAGTVALSAALDHPNRVFQLAHVLSLLEIPELLETLTKASGIEAEATRARCHVELANYFAAALLMPYAPFLERAEATQYDFDRLASEFDVTFEQVAHRLTTLHRDGARGVGFFLLRIDRAGNVTKRVNATAFALAEKGGACPVWNIHNAFATPGMMLRQLVEMPDRTQFFTISRTTDRPLLGGDGQDNRLVIALGCERGEAHRLASARPLNLDRSPVSKIGINCHLCPRPSCPQRAHQPVHMDLPLNTDRRGKTRYES